MYSGVAVVTSTVGGCRVQLFVQVSLWLRAWKTSPGTRHVGIEIWSGPAKSALLADELVGPKVEWSPST